MGTCHPDRTPFWPLRFITDPLFCLKIGLDIVRILEKNASFFDEFSLSLPNGSQMVIMHLNLHVKKYILV